MQHSVTEDTITTFVFLSSPNLKESGTEYMKDALFAAKCNGCRWGFASLELFE